MSLHFRADGGLDMRYSSSRAAVASGSYNSSGFYCGNRFRSSTSHSYSTSSCYSSPSSDLHYKKDGSLDMRYASSKAAVASSIQTTTETSSESKTPSLFTKEDIVLNQDGTINKNSRAVKSGDIKFNEDGTIDKRCSAYRQGKIVVGSNGQLDNSVMNLPERLNTSDLSTKDIRDNYSQQKYREESRSTQKDKKQVAHITDLEVMMSLLENKPGPHLTKEQLKEALKPISTRYRMRLTETNQGYDRDMAQRIIDYHDKYIRNFADVEDVRVTRGLENKVNQMIQCAKEIPESERNASTNWVLQELEKIREHMG